MLQIRPLTSSQPYLASAVSCKHILENTDHYIVEVKKVNQGDIYETFQWLKISKDLMHIEGLNLMTIDSSREVEERFFHEGYLKFNPKTGIFIEKFNSGQHHYALRGKDLEVNLIPVLEAYFFGDKLMVN